MFLETENGLLLRYSDGRWMEDRIVDFARSRVTQIDAMQILTEDIAMHPHYSVKELGADSLPDGALFDSELTLRVSVVFPGAPHSQPSLKAMLTIDRSMSLAHHGNAVRRIALASHSSKYITAVEYGASWHPVQLS